MLDSEYFKYMTSEFCTNLLEDIVDTKSIDVENLVMSSESVDIIIKELVDGVSLKKESQMQVDDLSIVSGYLAGLQIGLDLGIRIGYLDFMMLNSKCYDKDSIVDDKL